MSDDLEACLKGGEIIRLEGSAFEKFVARALEGAQSPAEKASALFLAVRDGILYDPFVPSFLPENYYPDNIVKAGRGYCVMKAALLCAAFRKAEIPARMGFADLRNQGTPKEMVEALGCDLFTWHGYTEAFIDGRWLKATPAFHEGLCRKRNIEPLVFDAQNHCVFPPVDLDGLPFATYVRYHGEFTDLPLDLIMKGWREVYTDARVDMWMEAFGIKPGAANSL